MTSSTGVASSTSRRSGKGNILTRILLWGAAAFFVVLAIWRFTWSVTVLEYGPPNATFFQPTTAKAGGQVLLWITKAQWFRRWPSTLHVTVICRLIDPFDSDHVIDGKINLEPHPIDVPKQVGLLPSKSRPFIVPQQCQPGPLTWSASAVSIGGLWGSWNPRYADPPELHMTVVK